MAVAWLSVPIIKVTTHLSQKKRSYGFASKRQHSARKVKEIGNVLRPIVDRTNFIVWWSVPSRNSMLRFDYCWRIKRDTKSKNIDAD